MVGQGSLISSIPNQQHIQGPQDRGALSPTSGTMIKNLMALHNQNRPLSNPNQSQETIPELPENEQNNDITNDYSLKENIYTQAITIANQRP